MDSDFVCPVKSESGHLIHRRKPRHAILSPCPSLHPPVVARTHYASISPVRGPIARLRPTMSLVRVDAMNRI